MSKNDSARHNSENVIFEEYKLLGYNFRLTDLQAAIALVQLKRLKSIIKKRRFLAYKYFDLGEKAMYSLKWAQAREYFHKAIDLDSTFAMAN